MYNTRSKSKKVSEKLAALVNIDPELSGDSGEDSATDEIPSVEGESFLHKSMCEVRVYISFSPFTENSDDSGTESEEEEEESESEEEEENGEDCETAADGTVWLKTALADKSGQKRVGRASAQNIIKIIPGPTPVAKRNITDILTAFSSMIDEELLEYIRECTEAEAHRSMGNNDWSISPNELKAFIAVLYARGAMGLKNMSVSNIFSTKYGPELIRGTMSRERFKSIMRYLRFDVKETRAERLQTDKFAMARQIWDKFIHNCRSCYAPGENITIDEQLFPSKTRCPFTQFLPKKPDKFGIMFYLAVDLRSKFVLNGFPFIGNDEQCVYEGSAADKIVLRLLEPFFGNGYCATMDNFFTSPISAKVLKDKRITVVGTVNKNRRWLPPTARKKNAGLTLHETILFAGPDNEILTLYQSKKSKLIGVFSTFHDSVVVGNKTNKKPDTIEYYNNTKYGVDITDGMAKAHSVKAASRRWPVHVFYNILDLAAINAWILYREVTGKKISRIKYLLSLADDLRKNYITSKSAPEKRPLILPDSPNKKIMTSSGCRPICQTPKCRNKSLGMGLEIK
ncbi:piggyBac transposable element-derived protein 4-like [Bradysia coprophila]|uniref:piggyBac transposable element-derived protein 4-like n=1 Tax=Bradysia coprophila TaxID=38358 RepID=UPI00187DAA4B|nr:piggyBac transposable element-derived protein 4-like [Bradysia coprophila]